MDNRVKKLYDYTLSGEHHKFRRHIPVDCLLEEFKAKNLNAADRTTKRLLFMLKSETPIVLKDEKISYFRTIENLPDIFTPEEAEQRSKTCSWDVGNICPDYISTIKTGLDYQKKRCVKRMETANDEQKKFLNRVIASINAVFDLSERYRLEAQKQGNDTVTDILSRIPHKGAKTFNEALQFFRILHFALWCEGSVHNGIGRFDCYMYEYWKRDLENGVCTYDELYNLLLEFFLSFNRDNDLYPGVQRGDNGQSMMLGGVDKDGNHVFNDLSEACLKASGEIMMIDPKINLRVDKNTPKSVFEKGTELTKKGLGFPQYSNDDVVIDGLVKLGYELADARDYTVAACWEFIIPKYGMDVPNIDAFNYVEAVNKSVDKLETFTDYDEFFCDVKRNMREQIDRLIVNTEKFTLKPSPFMSLLMDDCIERAQDICEGAKYNNFGFHGVAFASAVDSLTAIKKYVFDEHTISAESLKSAVKADFEGDSELLSILRYNTPKFGDDDEQVNDIACVLMAEFASLLKGRKNVRGGIFRPGTGSAMYYLWQAKEKTATAGGLTKSELFESNYSPSLYVRSKGPLSVIQSFTSPKLIDAINGGPLTMEFHNSVFSKPDGIDKVSQLVRQFVLLGGHQLQLNSVSHERMLDAQVHPENHQNLIVRVWGWSAYFVKLDREYQNHIIARQEFEV